ncbi:hypothetical protein HY250_04505 [Candidatus Azambacteria bacterium]|nr:hypothetical protein [Candidatus Azambacteria bacterium]
MNNVAAKNPVRPRKNTAEGGCGGNSAVFLQKIEAKPAALLVQSRRRGSADFARTARHSSPQPPPAEPSSHGRANFLVATTSGLSF